MNKKNQESVVDLQLKRPGDRLKNMLLKDHGEVLILKASSDWGTVLNMGRRGSFNAPLVIENLLLKMACHQDKNPTIEFREVCDFELEQTQNDLREAQNVEANQIFKLINESPTRNHVIHIGGGHDHFFPYITAILKKNLENNLAKKKILIINIDPHLDTRTDSWHNSGTPFRNIDDALIEINSNQHEITLFQIGTHLFANGESNFKNLSGIHQKIYFMDEIRLNQSLVEFAKEKLFSELNNFDEIILSIDIDAIKSSEMPAVSAPNHRGFAMEELNSFVHALKTKFTKKYHFTGIYEYNPMYDDLASSSGRQIAAFIYQNYLLKF